MATIDAMREQWTSVGKADAFEKRLDEVLTLVMRQTTYDRVAALSELERNGLSIEKTVVAYNRDGTEEKESISPTVNRGLNQTMFGEFRSFLDSAASLHARKKEVEEARKEALDKYLIRNQTPNA
jgi:hypothetical protein